VDVVQLLLLVLQLLQVHLLHALHLHLRAHVHLGGDRGGTTEVRGQRSDVIALGGMRCNMDA